MKSITFVCVCLVLAYSVCFVSSAPTVVTAPFVNVALPTIPFGIPHVAVAAPYVSVKSAHPRSSLVYPGLSYAYNSYPPYYPTYYSSYHPFSSVHIGWIYFSIIGHRRILISNENAIPKKYFYCLFYKYQNNTF